MGKNTSTTTSTSGNPAAMSAYYNLLPQIQQVAQTPFQPYGGEFVAPVNQQQQTGIAGVNANAYGAMPDLTQASGLLSSAGQPLTAAQINQYYSPYQQDVINATEAQFANTNAQQQQQVLGNAAAQGALGGDRTAVAQSVLAGQQQAQEAPVIAGLENQGYGQALQTAQQQFQQNPEAVAYGLGSTGTALENAGLTGASAQIGAGTLEQQTQQQLDTALYNQFLQQQGFPFQELSWATGLETGLGGAMGGTSTTTPPAPNPISTYGGLGLAALGLFANRGGRIPRRGLATGGSPFGMTPYGGVPSYIPTAAAPTPLHMNTPGAKNQQQPPKDPFTPQAITGADSGIKNILGNVLPGSDSYGGGNMFSGDAFGGSADNPLPGLSADDYGGDIATDVTGLFSNRGGRIPRAYGGLAIPTNNRIELKRGGVPVRAGLGLASFVNRRGYDDGGDVTPNDYIAQNFPGILPGVNGQPFDASDPDAAIFSPVAEGRDPKYSLANLTDTGLVPTDLPPEITAGQSNPPSSGLGTTQTLAFNDGRPISRIDTPPASEPTSAPHDYSADIKRPHGINFGLGMISPEAKAGLLAAGLGMMASRSPYAGVGIGQGGLQGLQTYSGLKKQEQDVDLAVAKLNQQAKSEQDRIALETKKFNAEYSQMTPFQKAQLDLTREQRQFQQMQPVKIGVDEIGRDIYAVRDPKTGAFHRIDPLTGNTTPTQTAPAQGVPTSQEQLPANSTPTALDTTPAGVRPDVLAGLDAGTVAQVKALDEGRMPFPSGFALKTPYWQNMLRIISQYDPSFDAVNYNSRARVRQDFVAGKSAQNITSFNTAIGHLDSLDKSIDPLGNTRFGWINPALQAGKSAIGDTQFQEAQKKFMATRQAVTDELTRAFRGSGGNVHDIVGWEQTINQADSPQALHAAVRAAVDLLRSRIESVGDTYNRGMGTTRDPLTLLSPHAQSTLKRLGGEGAPVAGLSTQDEQALSWANANPNDPRAAQIKARLGQ